MSARVTLGRALLALGQLDEAAAELRAALAASPSNLAAQRALGDTLRQQGNADDALHHYEVALSLAPNDPELDRTIRRLHAERDATRAGLDPVDSSRRAVATVTALERWMEALDATRAKRRA